MMAYAVNWVGLIATIAVTVAFLVIVAWATMPASVREARRWRRQLAREQHTGLIETTGLPDGVVPPSTSLKLPSVSDTPPPMSATPRRPAPPPPPFPVCDLVADLRWLAAARREYCGACAGGNAPRSQGEMHDMGPLEMAVHLEHETAERLADILDGSDDAKGWLPSWRWSDWEARR